MSGLAPTRPFEAVVIGASAGAVDALLQILPALPKSYPLALLVVVHLPPDSKSTLADLLDSHSEITVKEAEDKEAILPGTGYLAPPNYHLLVEPDFTLSLSSEAPVLYSRPSIDILFESAADAFGDSLAGIILTGGNSDGAKGLQAVDAVGGAVFVQSPETAACPEMPRAALQACPQARALSLEGITTLLKEELPSRCQ